MNHIAEVFGAIAETADKALFPPLWVRIVRVALLSGVVGLATYGLAQLVTR